MVLHSAFLEHVYTTFMQHETHTTRLCNTQIETLSRKEKLAFIEVVKGGTYIQIELGFSL